MTFEVVTSLISIIIIVTSGLVLCHIYSKVRKSRADFLFFILSISDIWIGWLTLMFMETYILCLYIKCRKIKKQSPRRVLWKGACNFIKKETLAQVFSCEFCEISKNTFFYRTPLVAASENWSIAISSTFFLGLFLHIFLHSHDNCCSR